MSLEAAIKENNELLSVQNGILAKLLERGGKTEDTGGAKAETSKTSKAETTKTSKAENDDLTLADLDAKIRPWLGEFPKDHPESAARKEVFAATLKKLDVAKMSLITKPGDLVKLNKWFDTKAKAHDAGFGVGRFAADPESDGNEGSSDDDL